MEKRAWLSFFEKPFVIAGPCSAESEWQVMETAKQLKTIEAVKIFRAGVWKPRTRPNSFEGIGSAALQWVADVQTQLGVPAMIEVADKGHVEQALKAGIQMLWIGARTTVNPFYVQAIADALKGVDIPVFIKNPIHPELHLWVGAIERIAGAGVSKIAAIHRGFYQYPQGRFRNEPHWEVPIQLKTQFPDLPIVCDPSHIAGKRDLIFEISQKAMDINFDGLMIETHHQPEKALSDAAQQITPARLKEILELLQYRNERGLSIDFSNHLHHLRLEIDEIDKQLLHTLSQRFDKVKSIGKYKKDNNVAVLQLERFLEILKTRGEEGKQLNLSEAFIKTLFDHIHQESIQIQTEIFHR
jgi:chorismate mutase